MTKKVQLKITKAEAKKPTLNLIKKLGFKKMKTNDDGLTMFVLTPSRLKEIK
jgi:hypothetical protein